MEKASPFPSEIGDAFRKGSENVPTLRFTLSLPASDDKTCPEYSFLDLVKSATRKSGETPEKTPWDDEDGDDEKLRALAKKFEQKYAPKPTSKKRRRDRMEDLIDVTYGYDETDPFVDDSEAYDELLPADWTTEHGGFYINQGALNFRPVSPGGESEQDEGDFQKPKKLKLKSPKKMPKVPKVKKVKVPGEKKERKKSGDKEKKPRKSSSSEKEKEKKEKKHKKRLSLGNANIVNMLSSPSSSAKNTSATVSSNMALATGGSQGTNNVTVNSSSPQKVQNSSQQSNQGIVKTEPGMVNGSSSAVTTEENASVTKSDSLLSSTLQNGISAGEASSSEIAEPSLPQCLPTDVEACIMRLKQAGTDGITEGKCKFFNSDVNHMLLELETKSRALSSKVRSGIYEFLAFYLPCTKETLLKRAKNLLLNDQAGRLREPMAKLKAAVDRVIPEQIKRFEEEVRQHVEEESKKQGGQKQDGENPDDHKKELFKSAMEVVEDSEKSDEITTPTDPNAPSHPEDKAKKNTPKRKFIWTEELRGLLCDVVQMKMKIFQMSKTRAQSAEEYLKAFFENEVRPLWPKGWMTSRILLRESKTVHGKFTSVPARVPKKAPGPKKQGESPENQDSNAGGNPVAKVLPSSNSLVVNIGSSSVTTATPALSAATVTPAISALKNLVQSGQAANIKTAAPVIHSTVATSVPKPVVSTATATKMESTTVNRPELTLQIVPIITDLKLNKKDTASKSSSANRSLGSDCVAKKDNASKPPNPSLLLESPKSKTPVTILDFADMISPEGQADTSKLLHSQQSIPAKQQLASFLNKTPSPTKEKPKDQPLTHLPSSVVTTAVSHPAQSSTVSPARTQTALTSPPKVVRSSPVTIPSVNQSVLLAATVGNLTAAGLPNNFIDLASLRQQPRPAVDLASSLMQQQKAAADLASSLMQQQQQQQQLKAAVDLASTLRQQQQQQKAAVTAGGTPPSQTVLESITSPRRSSVDLKSCQTVLPGFTPHQGMSPQSIAMSLSSSMPSQAMHQAQPPNLTLFGSAGNLQAGKVTTPLTHLGIAPHTLQSAMLHLSRQTQEQSGIVLPQNHFNNQVLLGMNPTSTQSLPSLQLPHAALLSNQPVYQDPNQTSSTGTHPSPFLPRFS